VLADEVVLGVIATHDGGGARLEALALHGSPCMPDGLVNNILADYKELTVAGWYRLGESGE
jgi:hypothetical protein